jgi:hypothetical protein
VFIQDGGTTDGTSDLTEETADADKDDEEEGIQIEAEDIDTNLLRTTLG